VVVAIVSIGKRKISVTLDLCCEPFSITTHCQKIKEALDKHKFVRHSIAEPTPAVVG